MAQSLVVARGFVIAVAGTLCACSEPSGSYRPFKADWHESCKVAVFLLPGRVASLVPRKSKTENSQLGECSARRVEGQIWHVAGRFHTEQLKGDGVAPAHFVTLMLEDNDPSSLYVQRHGTQYHLCSIAVNGVDLTGNIRLNACGEAAYLSAFVKKHKLDVGAN